MAIENMKATYHWDPGYILGTLKADVLKLQSLGVCFIPPTDNMY